MVQTDLVQPLGCLVAGLPLLLSLGLNLLPVQGCASLWPAHGGVSAFGACSKRWQAHAIKLTGVALEHPFEDFAKVLEQVEAIGDLSHGGSTQGHCVCKGAMPITTND